MPRWLSHSLALAAVAWVAWGFGREVRTAVMALTSPPEPDVVWRWRLGDPGPATLGHFLADVGPAIPAGSVVALASATGSAAQDFFLRQWAAYRLPLQRVILLDSSSPTPVPAAATPASPAPPPADYVVSYGTRLDTPWLEEVLRRPQGALYRVLPWAGSL